MSNDDTKTEERRFVRFGASAPRKGPSLAGNRKERLAAIAERFPDLEPIKTRSSDGG
ncbi:hypothetical protein [Hyphomicrobium sp.]|uniref:hypothetical protein n=1 Tax=Hyphomicrobium sp. TaxID=82 RepID=UPI002C2DBE86|nr:hypothetical protein [Hyphomicrobium sp.]HRQ25800.1 hypothetical protein [Hyphomicrobium sp.]